MKVKPVGTKQGLQWILNGVYQFRQNPLVWIILCGTLYAIIATLSFVLELYGLLVFIILFPSGYSSPNHGYISNPSLKLITKMVLTIAMSLRFFSTEYIQRQASHSSPFHRGV